MAESLVKMDRKALYLDSPEATLQFSTRLATCLEAPLLMTFSGDIGMGKTTLIRGLLHALGVTGPVKSPTFSLVEHYDVALLQATLYHVDLYRIQDETELEYIGFRDFFTPQSICCIEWPERTTQWLESADLAFALTPQREGRHLMITPFTARGSRVMSQL